MHARRSALGPGVKDAPLTGPDEQLQLDLYAETDTPLLRTDRLPPASFERPPQAESSRPRLPHFRPPTNDYSADLNLAELLMSDTDDSLGSAGLGHLTLSSLAPMRTQQSGAKFANAPSRAHRASSRFDMRFASRSVPMDSTPSMPSLSWSPSSTNSSPATTSSKLSPDQLSTAEPQRTSQPDQEPTPKDEPSSPPTPKARSTPVEAATSPTSNTTSKRPARTTRRSPAPRRQECTTCGKRFQRPCQLVTNEG
ncbi:unnamed protein product [Rhizoctonia solani]|uniref:Uncharacterized protein n=1 Tax=Rhizoctonia solani TaxID=456999 RepID=A0A8H3CTY8_9AGAM|nr:unnamed protein product [Rhizoctonia solani]